MSTHCLPGSAVTAEFERSPEICTCLALRQASRHVTQFYDHYMARVGLRTTQYSILSKLKRHGAMSINALAEAMVMDRTTLGRNILPLQRMHLIAVRRGRDDKRVKELHLTEAGIERQRAGFKTWQEAQAKFEGAFGGERTRDLGAVLRAVTESELPVSAAAE